MVLVARTGAEYLGRTLAALARQTRRPDTVIAVSAGSTDGSAELLSASGPTQLVSIPRNVDFGSAVAHALHIAAPVASEDDWLWLLAHDNAAEPDALAELLAAVEIAPSVAIAGPKLMRWEQPDVIAGFGETVTGCGTSIALVDGELDQFQHDVHSDVLGVAAHGMLVRRSLWDGLGGLDPGLPAIDAGLDFSLRARLAGHRVIVVPGAKVASVGGPALFGRRAVSEARRARLAREAQLHRRLVYAPRGALLLHWLSLVPLAVVRSIGQLLAKRPGAIGGEFAAAFGTAFGGGVHAARRNFRRTKRLGWGTIAPLRMPWPQVRERRAQDREPAVAAGARRQGGPLAGFVAHGGLWITAVAAVVGLIAFAPLLSAPAVAGGALAPLAGQVADLWANVGYGWREIGTGFAGAADPFAYVVAVLGSLTFWAPSLSIVLFYLLSLPLAAIGAWFCARRLSQRPWLPAVAALLWLLAPPLLGSLTTGHLGAAIAHILLPWLALAVLNTPRSWAAAATGALLFAAIAASAPVLVPALLALWIAWLVTQPKSVHRIIGIPIPALALFAPLIIEQFVRGNPLALLADPGVPVPGTVASGWRLALGDAGTGLHGWTRALDALALPGASAAVIVTVLLAPIGVLALLALFVPGSRRAIPSLVVALLGFVTAVAGSRIEVAVFGEAAVPIWPGAALSLFWLGLVGAVIVALDALGRPAVASAFLAGVTTAVLAVPLLGVVLAGTAGVHTDSGRILPAVVTAEAEARPWVGTLLISPQSDGSIAAVLERGEGATLDDQSTLAATDTTRRRADVRLATVAGNLASRSGYDASADLASLDIGFVVLADRPGNDATHLRVAEALDSNGLLVPVGETANGLLWRFQHLPATDPAPRPGNTDTSLGAAVLVAQGVVFGLTLLLGIPTRRRRRRGAVSGSREQPSTFDEDDDDE